MSLRVGLDIDGVLADFTAAFRRAAAEVLDRVPDQALDPDQAVSTGALTSTEVRRVWDRILRTPNWWSGLAPYEPGQINRLYTLARQHRWEVVFLTTRPPSCGETVQFQTQWWLERQGFYLPAVITVPGSRGEVANALRLDAVVDDRLLNCLEVIAASQAKSLLLQRDGDPAVDDQATARGIATARTLEETIDALVALFELQQGKRGRLTRLSDWFRPRPRTEDMLPLDGRKVPPLETS